MMDEKTKKMIIVVIILIGLSFGLKLYITAAKDGMINTPFHDVSTLTINVESTHIIYNADYDLYVDGELVKEWRMGPKSYWEFTYEYRTLITDPNRYIEVKVVSTGGGFGTQADSVMLLVGTGADYSFTLRA